MNTSPLCPSRLAASCSTSVSSPRHDACAGLAARMSTQMARERAEQRRLREEEADFERVMSLNLGPMNSLDGEQEVSLASHPGMRLSNIWMRSLTTLHAMHHRTTHMPRSSLLPCGTF